MEQELVTLSFTRINMAERCGMQYYFRYEEGKKVPPGVAAVIGRNVHLTSEEDYRMKLQSGLLLPVDVLQDMARDGVRRSFDDGVLITEDEKAVGVKALKGQVVDETTELALLHHNEVAPTVEPADVEHKWSLKIPQIGVKVIGYTDLITTERVVRDLKTSARKPKDDAAGESNQLTVYGLAEWAENGKYPPYYQLDYLVRRSKRLPARVITQKTVRRAEDYQAVLARISRVAEMVRKEVYMPAPKGSWVCSPKFCGYYHECPFVT